MIKKSKEENHVHYDVFAQIEVCKKPITIYGDKTNLIFLVKDIIKWIGEDISYDLLLDSVEDSDRMIVKITDYNGRKHTAWAITEHGLYTILNLFPSGELDEQAFYETIHIYSKILEENPPKQQNITNNKRLYTMEELLNNPDFVISALSKLKEEQNKNKQLSVLLESKDDEISELKPKAEYYDKILSCKNAISISSIAKEYGKSALWLNNLLHKLKIQYKRDGVWILYSRYADRGYTCTKTFHHMDEFGIEHSSMHTYWTQSGRKFIYDILKKTGIEPIGI